MARCFAVVINHAPGLSGTPDSGHFSSATTRASWASSSATPTSRTMRASPAISLADSILHTASITLWVSVADTVATFHPNLFPNSTNPRLGKDFRECKRRHVQPRYVYGSYAFPPAL